MHGANPSGDWYAPPTDRRRSWFIDDPATVSDRRVALASDLPMPPATSTVLEFWHRVNAESTYDGGVLEVPEWARV